MRSDRVIVASGEEELLAFYLEKLDADGDHGFVIPQNVNLVCLDAGHWEAFQKHPQRKAQLVSRPANNFTRHGDFPEHLHG